MPLPPHIWTPSFPELVAAAHELRRRAQWMNAAAVYLEAANSARAIASYAYESAMLRLAWDCGWQAQGRTSELEL